MIKNKKGIMLGQAFTAVMMLILVAILVIVSLVIFSSLHTATVVKNTAGVAVNETVTPTDVGVYLAANSYESGACGTITQVYNSTSGTLLTSGNYTQSGCLIANTSSEYIYGWQVNYPYTYSASSSASNASDSMVSNFSGYPALIGLVGTIIFLALVIGVLVASFMMGGKRGA